MAKEKVELIRDAGGAHGIWVRLFLVNIEGSASFMLAIQSQLDQSKGKRGNDTYLKFSETVQTNNMNRSEIYFSNFADAVRVFDCISQGLGLETESY
jgi:hypothetical protein